MGDMFEGVSVCVKWEGWIQPTIDHLQLCKGNL